MSNLVDWAKKELEMLVSNSKGSEMQEQINKDILEVVIVFSEQGHSGFSASYAITLITRLLDWKPITPLTGEDSEWGEVEDWHKDENLQQNKRCSAVFRKNFDNSTAYYLHGKVFSDDGGKTWFTNRDSHVPVTFPYIVPDKPEYVVLEEVKGVE